MSGGGFLGDCVMENCPRGAIFAGRAGAVFVDRGKVVAVLA